MTALSILIPAHNAAHFLPRCLDALVAQIDASDEIIVVDDGSSDATARMVTRPRVRLLSHARRCGPSVTRNTAAAAASNGLLLFVDSDVVVAPGMLAKVRAHFAAHPRDAALIGSYDAKPEVKAWLSQYRNLLHHFVHQHTAEHPSHFWTGLGAVRRDAFEAVGGFDAAEILEDVEFGYRLRRAGHAITLDPTLQGTHLKHWTLRGMLYTDIFLRAKPWTRLILGARYVASDFSLGLRERASVVLAWLTLGLCVLAPASPSLLAVAALAVLAFVVINRAFLGFLLRSRGVRFAAAAVGMHLLYCFSCGVGLALGIASHLTGLVRPNAPAASARSSS
jgi:glycosyltransferase involved in cell wall biosynthesis